MLGFHPVWLFLMVFSCFMVIVSFYEGKNITKNIEKKSTKIYVQIALIAFWGFLVLFALSQAGYLL